MRHPVLHSKTDVCVAVHMNDHVYKNGWMVTEGDNYCVEDGNDECFTMMLMIITIVVLVSLPSVTE